MSASNHLRLGVNIDHVATVRERPRRATARPAARCPACRHAGADGITAHLRGDRRHIVDADIEGLMAELTIPLNFPEMAATEDGRDRVASPPACRLYRAGEARGGRRKGLDAAGQHNHLRPMVSRLRATQASVSRCSSRPTHVSSGRGRPRRAWVELHTGRYCELEGRPTGRTRPACGRARPCAPSSVSNAMPGTG